MREQSKQSNNLDSLPDNALIRKPLILGDKKLGTTGLLNISNTAWYNGINAGIYPKPVKLSARSVAWRLGDIRSLIEKIGA